MLEHGREVHHGDQRQVVRPGQSRSENGSVRAEMMASSGHPRMDGVMVMERMLHLRPEDNWRWAGCFAYQAGDREVAGTLDGRRRRRQRRRRCLRILRSGCRRRALVVRYVER